MLRELLEREQGWKAAPIVALVAAVSWPFISTASESSPAAGFCSLCFVYVLFGSFHQRATVFESGLPIPGRDLVAARLLALLAVLWLPALLMMGETVVLRGWENAIPLLEMAAASSLVVLITQSFRIREISPPSWFGYAVAASVGFPLIHRPELLSHWGAMLGGFVAGSAALLARLWYRVPTSFQIAPRKPRSSRFSMRRPSWRCGWLPVWWPAWRSFFNWRDWSDLILVVFPLELGMSAVIGGLLVKPAVWRAGQRLEWLNVLPIPRRRLLLMMMAPWFCILIALLSLSGHFRSATKAPLVSTGYSDVWQEKKPSGSGTPNVLVPASYWHWAWARKAPAIQSPWGERTQPKTFHRLGPAFYNPYSVAPENSARFLDWQFARATEAVYGRSIQLSQVGESERSGLVPVTRRVRTQSIELLVATLVFLGVFHLAFWPKTRRGQAWRWSVWLGLVAPFLCDPFTTRYVIQSGPLSDVIALRLAAILPQNPAALLVVAALLIGGLYWAVEKQFERVDLIPDLKPAENS